MLGSFIQSAKSLVTKPVVTFMHGIGNYSSFSSRIPIKTQFMQVNNTLRVQFAGCPTVYAECEDYYQPQIFDFPGVKNCTEFSVTCGHNYVVGEVWDFSKHLSTVQQYYRDSQEAVLSYIPSYEQVSEQTSGVGEYVSSWFNMAASQGSSLFETLQENGAALFSQSQGAFYDIVSWFQGEEEFKPCDWDDFNCHQGVLTELLSNCHRNATCQFEVLYNYAQQYDLNEIYADIMEKYIPSQEEMAPYAAMAGTALAGMAGLYLLWRKHSRKPATMPDDYALEAQALLAQIQNHENNGHCLIS